MRIVCSAIVLSTVLFGVQVSAQTAVARPATTLWSIDHALGLPDGVTLSATIRARYETIDGQARTPFNDSDSLLNLRTTLFGAVDAGGLRLAAEIYDSRTYGGNPGTPLSTGEVDALELVQAYAKVSLGSSVSGRSKANVQFGRFVLALGSRRLIANDDYRNTTNSFTGVRGDVTTGSGVAATLIYTLPQRRLPDDGQGLLANRVVFDRESFDTVLWGGLIAKRRAIGSAMAESSFYHFGERDGPSRLTRDRSLNSADVRLIQDPAVRWTDYEIEAIYQFGRISADLSPIAARIPVSAYFVHADFGYTLAGRWKPRVSAEFDLASGDGRERTFGRFDTLYGMRRADLGPAGLYSALARSNLLTPALRVEVTPSKRTDAFFTYRAMWLASHTDSFASTGVRDAGGRSGRFAGHQLEARIRHWLVPDALMVEADANWLIKGRFLTDAPNAPRNGNTRYLSINLNGYF